MKNTKILNQQERFKKLVKECLQNGTADIDIIKKELKLILKEMKKAKQDANGFYEEIMSIFCDHYDKLLVVPNKAG